MANLIQTFRGFSGNQIYLMENEQSLFVRKIGTISRNVERMTTLRNVGFPVPHILRHSDITLDMEYIHGLDIKTYLKSHQPNRLLQFLIETIEQLIGDEQFKDYTEIYKAKLQEVDFSLLPFTLTQLLAQLPAQLPQSNYVGDLTLENIIYTEDGFYLIDCATIEYDSYIFDIAKLRQDLDLHWFTRNSDVVLDVKTNFISQQLCERYPLADNDYLLILMLLRVYRHAAVGSREHEFLLEGIKRLWK
jgi:tRNA A-37 threonylcarbamoyl transferase component Bud32